jgi:hypothetical protein
MLEIDLARDKKCCHNDKSCFQTNGWRSFFLFVFCSQKIKCVENRQGAPLSPVWHVLCRRKENMRCRINGGPQRVHPLTLSLREIHKSIHIRNITQRSVLWRVNEWNGVFQLRKA